MVARTRGLVWAGLLAAVVGIPWASGADTPAKAPASPAASAASASSATPAAPAARSLPPSSSLTRVSGTAVPARQALGTTIAELNVDNVPLSRVLEYLRDVSGANLVVNWRVLEAANVMRDTPVTLTVVDVPLRKVLRLVLDQASPATTLVFPVDSNVISITSQEDADKVLVMRVYVVDDLVMTNNTPNPPPQMDLQKMTANGTTTGGTGGGTTGSGGSGLFTTTTQQPTAADADTPAKRGADLVKLIEDVVRPNIWRENGGVASIKYFSGKLVVTAPQSVQEAIGGPMLPEGGQRLGGM